jgi:hypothetical protein
MVATSDGIVRMALTAADFVQTDIVLVGVLIMAALGYGLTRALERRVVTGRAGGPSIRGTSVAPCGCELIAALRSARNYTAAKRSTNNARDSAAAA